MTGSRFVFSAAFWLAVTSAFALAACATDEPAPDLSATPDTSVLAPGEPSDMVRQYVDDRLAELGEGSTIYGEGRASRVRCADLSEKYLGKGEWEVTTAFDGSSVPRLWHVHEDTGEIEDMVPSELHC